jgi:methionine sulfoxide reductase heme-binding subunit
MVNKSLKFPSIDHRFESDYRTVMLRTILNNRLFLWVLLALPALVMLIRYWQGQAIAMELLHPTGEFSARLMITAMMLGPLSALIGPRRWLNWLIMRRRYLGVAAFGYAVLHLIFYIIDMETVEDMLAEIGALGIWTGWVAMLLFVPLALTSNNTAMRALKANWKRLQRLVYPTAILVLVHWIFVHNNLGPALVHFIPLIALIAMRAFRSPSPLKQGV